MTRRRRRVATVWAGVAVIALIAEAGLAQETHVVDGETWVMSDEEAALCTRALVECTPLFAKFRAETQRAARKEKDLVEKLMSARSSQSADREELMALRERVSGLERELDAVQASYSWWLTTPLRWLHSFFASEDEAN